MRSLCRNAGRTTFYALRIKYSAHFIGTLHGCCTVSRLVFFVLQDALFGGFQVHGPAALPIVSFTRKTVEDVTGITVSEAADFIPLEFDGIKDF